MFITEMQVPFLISRKCQLEPTKRSSPVAAAMLISHSSLDIAKLARPTSLLWPVGRLAARKMEVITGPVLLQMPLKPSPKRCGTSPKQVLPVAAF